MTAASGRGVAGDASPRGSLPREPGGRPPRCPSGTSSCAARELAKGDVVVDAVGERTVDRVVPALSLDGSFPSAMVVMFMDGSAARYPADAEVWRVTT